MNDLNEELNIAKVELNNFKQKHGQQVINYKKTIDQLKEMLKNEEANKDNAIREQYRDRMEEVQQIINDSQVVFNEKAGLVHQLNSSIVKKVNNTELVNEMRDVGKKEAEKQYKNILEENVTQHEQEIENLKSQYEYLLSEKQKELEKFVQEFKEYHASKKEEIHATRNEVVNLYKICKKMNTIIENVEKGVYTNGIRSAYIPKKEKPKLPDRFSNKVLSKVLNKTKIASSQSQFLKEEDTEEIEDEEILAGDDIISSAYKRPSAQLDNSVGQSQAPKMKIIGSEGVRKETLENLITERDKYKSMYQSEVKKNNNNKIVIESQKRLLDKSKLNMMTNKIGGKDMMRPKTQGRFI